MNRPSCRYEGCSLISVKSCKGWCSMHHTRWRRHGDPSIVKPSNWPRKDAAATIADRTVADANGCRVWQGARLPKGYGVFGITGHSRYVHRAAWELANGPVPDGLELHHTCDNPPCCNPDHLQALTVKEHRAAHRAMKAAA